MNDKYRGILETIRKFCALCISTTALYIYLISPLCLYIYITEEI